MAVSALVTIGSSALSAAPFVTGAAAFNWALFLTNAAIGLTLLALSPKPSRQGANRGYEVNTRGAALDHQIIYGKVRVGGAIVFEGSTDGSTDNPAPNYYLWQVIAHAGHSIEGYEDVYLNNKKVTEWRLASDRTTVVSNPSAVANGTALIPWKVCDVDVDGAVTASCTDRYVQDSNQLVLSFYDGTQTTADSRMVADVSEWTTDHKLLNTAYMTAMFGYDQDVYPNGIPEITATIKGKKVYDTRTGNTVWSDNPALCLRDYLSNGYGLNEDSSNIDDDLVSSSANVCDQTVTDGSTRYTCNGAFTTASSPYDNLNNLLTSMGGLLWYAQGEWRMKPAYWVAPTLSLDENDLRSSIAVKTRHSRRDNFNIVKGTFRGPESNWVTTDYPQVTNVTSAGSLVTGAEYTITKVGTTDFTTVGASSNTEGVTFTATGTATGTGEANSYLGVDNGQESVVDFDLPFTDNSKEARRLARIMLERNRQQLTISASFGLNAFKAQVGDVIQLTVDRFGWSNKDFEVTSWTFGLTDQQDLQVQMTLREISASVFDEVDDGAALELDNTNLVDPFTAPVLSNLSVVNAGLIAEDGSYVNSFSVSWDVDKPNLVSKYSLEWKKSTDSVYNSVSLNTQDYQISPLVDGVNYDVRVRATTELGVHSDYISVTGITAGKDTTAPSLPTGLGATGGYNQIAVTWANPSEADLKHVEVYVNTSNTTSGATLLGTVDGTEFIHTGLGNSVQRYYFLKSVDFTGNKSAFTTGVSATTNAEVPDGNDGERGPGRWYIPITDTRFASLPITEANAQTAWNDVSGTSDIPLAPVKYDQVIYYTGTEANPTNQQAFICSTVSSSTNHTWNEQEELIDGDLLVTGTVTADKMIIDGQTIENDSGTLKIKDLGVDTLQIRGNAVSTSEYHEEGVFHLGDGTWEQLEFGTGSALQTVFAPAGTVTRVFFSVVFSHDWYAQRDWSFWIERYDGSFTTLVRRDDMAENETSATVTGSVELDLTAAGTVSQPIGIRVQWKGQAQSSDVPPHEVKLRPETSLALEISYK